MIVIEDASISTICNHVCNYDKKQVIQFIHTYKNPMIYFPVVADIFTLAYLSWSICSCKIFTL